MNEYIIWVYIYNYKICLNTKSSSKIIVSKFLMHTLTIKNLSLTPSICMHIHMIILSIFNVHARYDN